MAIPTLRDILIPFLGTLSDGAPHRMRDETIPALRQHFALSDDDLRQRLPSGNSVFPNRAWFARTTLKQMGFIEYPSRGYNKITDLGRHALTQYAEGITYAEINRITAENFDGGVTTSETPVESSPEEQLVSAHNTYRATVEHELLNTIATVTPEFFEQLVVDFMVKLGYGGVHEDAAKAVGQSNDGGIDGIIKDDVLGLETIYLQAKRWQGSVGRQEIQQFAGALAGRNARKGVFITTSTFSAGAHEYVQTVGHSIVLIDGKTLARYMYEYGLGVTKKVSLDVKTIDQDYFEEQ